MQFRGKRCDIAGIGKATFMCFLEEGMSRVKTYPSDEIVEIPSEQVTFVSQNINLLFDHALKGRK